MADAANADADEVEDNSNLTVRMPALQPASPQASRLEQQIGCSTAAIFGGWRSAADFASGVAHAAAPRHGELRGGRRARAQARPRGRRIVAF